MQASGEPSPLNDLPLDMKVEAVKQIDRASGDFRMLAALATVSTSWRDTVRAYSATVESVVCRSPEHLSGLCGRITGLGSLTLYKGRMTEWEMTQLKSCTRLTKLVLDGDAYSSDMDSSAASQLFPPLDLSQLPTSLQTLALQNINVQQSSLHAFRPAALKTLTLQMMSNPPKVIRTLLRQLPDLRVRSF